MPRAHPAGPVERLDRTAPLRTLVGVAASAASVLALEVALTRLFAVTQLYHFAFLAVSLAVLGFGASGSFLAVVPRLGRGGPRRWALLAAAQSAATVAAYLAATWIPFDSFRIALERMQLVYLAGYYLALTLPFFFGGVVIGTLLAGWDQPAPLPSRTVYAATLAGSGVGALLAVGATSRVGGEGSIAAAALLALVAALLFETAADPRSLWRTGALAAGAAVLALATWSVPAGLDMRLSEHKGLTVALRYPGAEIVSTTWTPSARVDHVRSEGIRSLPGLSFTYDGVPPPQEGVTFDGDDLSPIPLVRPEDADFAPYLLGSLAFVLRPDGDALVLRPRGGLDVVVALANGAASVTAVEPSRAAVTAARTAPVNPYDDPRVEVIATEPRAYVERTERRFDVVDLALTSSYRPVDSGAYSLTEDYERTTEAFERYLDRLRPGGIFTAVRWLQTPPSEETRLVALAATAARRSGIDPVGAVVALRGYATAVVLVKPDGFDLGELDAIRAFAADRRFDLVAAPGLTAAEANVYNRLPRDRYHPLATALLGSGDAGDVGAVVDATEFDIGAPTDDHPFFAHFFRWSQLGDVVDGLGRTWQPFGGAGYLVLLALLVLSIVGAALLIAAPLALGRSRRRGGWRLRCWTVGYFGSLGIAFFFVEIPLIQRYILLIGSPTGAVATVLFGLLTASGAGSLASGRLPWRLSAAGVVAASLLTIVVVQAVTITLLAAPVWMRVFAGIVVLAPLGFLMGTMFPKGVAHLEGRSPDLVPWAWGINGVASVISAAASALLALSFGFRFVVVAGALCYAVAAVLSRPADPSAGISRLAYDPRRLSTSE